MSRVKQLDPAIEPVFITAKQLAEKLQVSRRTIWRMRSAGQLPAPFRVGGIVRWRVKEILEWIRRGCPKRT